MHEAGKGSGRRPMTIDTATFDDNWKRAFGSPKQPNDKHECKNNCPGCKCKSKEVGVGVATMQQNNNN